MSRSPTNWTPITLTELDADVERYNIAMLPEYRQLDNWIRCEVEPHGLRDMHGDFGRGDHHVALRKGARFDQLLEHFRADIDRGDFPVAEDIRAEWPDKPPVVVLRMVSTGELYLCDGEKRVLNACYHRERVIRALLADADEDREVVASFP